MILKLTIIDTKSYVFKTAFTRFEDIATIIDAFTQKSGKVEEVIKVKVGSNKELTSVDFGCFDKKSCL